jgi:DNA-binding NtrC family response regulator
VIMMSGYQMEKRTSHFIRAGARMFLQKPFDMAYAARIMRRILDGELSKGK